MDELRVGIIGVGGRGEIARHIAQPGFNVRVVAGADVDEAALAGFRVQHGPATFTSRDYREVLARSDVDAVIVCTPDFVHEEHGIAALEAGKHVYLEKPMAITVEGADRLLDAARRTGTKLYVGHNLRHFAVVRAMKDLIDAGTIGDVQAVWCRHFVSIGGDAYYRDWHSQRRNVGSLLVQKAVHDIDVIHWLAGGYASAVTGMGRLSVYDKAPRREAADPVGPRFDTARWPPLEQRGYSPEIDVEDHAMLLLQLDNGVQASYMQCQYAPDYWRNYTFIGTNGRLENVGDAGAWSVRAYTTRTDRLARPDRVLRSHGTRRDGEADARTVAEFLRWVRDGAVPGISPVAARYAVAAAVAGTESLRTDGARRTVPPLRADLAAYFTGFEASPRRVGDGARPGTN